jgi:hypothetical protein
MLHTKQRLPRFKRDPEAAGSFRITARDIEILRHIAEHRFIRSGCLVRLVGGSRQQLLRRLNLLYHHGYLERPRAQLDYYHEGGSKDLVYGLASRGAGRLRRDLNMAFHRMDWLTRKKGGHRLFLEHTLMVSDFMTALEIDCRTHPEVRLIYAHELSQPKGRGNCREPFRWTVVLPGKSRVGVVPDKVFALEMTHLAGRIERTHYFLEADQGTMPIERRDLRQSCVLRKLRAYESTHATDVHRTRLKAENFRVLIVTPQAIRAQNIREVVSNLEKGRRLFFVFSDDDWRSCDGLLDLVTPYTQACVNSR